MPTLATVRGFLIMSSAVLVRYFVFRWVEKKRNTPHADTAKTAKTSMATTKTEEKDRLLYVSYTFPLTPSYALLMALLAFLTDSLIDFLNLLSFSLASALSLSLGKNFPS